MKLLKIVFMLCVTAQACVCARVNPIKRADDKAAAAAAADALIKKHETREDKHCRGARTEELRDEFGNLIPIFLEDSCSLRQLTGLNGERTKLEAYGGRMLNIASKISRRNSENKLFQNDAFAGFSTCRRSQQQAACDVTQLFTLNNCVPL